MTALRGQSARRPLLDAWRNPQSDVRIAVDSWCIQEPVTGQYIERPASVRMAWNYWRRIGVVAVWRKIRSRRAEARRNRKVAGVGAGRVLQAPAGSGFDEGQRIVFFAPNHSPDWPRLSLDVRLIRSAERAKSRAGGDKTFALPEALRAYAGWSPYSGTQLDGTVVERELRRIVDEGHLVPDDDVLPAKNRASAEEDGRERIEAGVAHPGGRTAVLFGLGNYAKTQIIPHVRRHLQLAAIHEIDPDQIASADELGAALDTSPCPREMERYDAWFIAGFHHSHALIAVRALQDGAYAVVEKPLVTTRGHLTALEDALGVARPRKLFTCFHRRYSPMNAWARMDLGVGPGDPVDMHCIVYEIPLPALHWYNWTNSGSRLISNGCHWLDYFLYVNNFTPVKALHVQPLRGRDLVASVHLENDAYLVMSLTDAGSERLGVRDVIDLRANGVTVRLVDSTYYDAESTARVLRRRRVNPMDGFTLMYDSICRRIVAGEEGDALESLRSTALMLDLEDQLRRQPRA